MNEVGIIIPYYHNELTEYEKISFLQCRRVLQNYPIILLIPDNWPKEKITNLQGILIEKVPAEWLESVYAYNAMMQNIDFYKRFQEYRYILIYQLDAFVFSDRLLEMCSYGYDYIGAPWLTGYFHYKDESHCIWRVGNGGFSLRKIDSFIELLSTKDIINYDENEDFVFSISDSNSFKVAPLEIALKFSFEREVRKCFALNNDELPFGCHAWEKYDLEFFAPFIKSFGYDVYITDNNDCNLEELYEKQRNISFFWENIFSINWVKKKILGLFSKEIKGYVIWGAGYYGKVIYKILMEAKLPLMAMMDSNSELVSKKIGEVEIVKTNSEILDENVGIIIAVKNGNREIIQLLNERGYVYKKDYILFTDIIEA